jgi:hypothetical protein
MDGPEYQGYVPNIGMSCGLAWNLGMHGSMRAKQSEVGMALASYSLTPRRKWLVLSWIGFGAAVGLSVMALYASIAQEAEFNLAEFQGRWTLELMDGQPVELKMAVYFEINGKAIKGFDGCNNFSGSLENPVLIRKGQRDCVGEYASLPLNLSSPMEHLQQAKITGDVLSLPIGQGGGEAKFRRNG